MSFYDSEQNLYIVGNRSPYSYSSHSFRSSRNSMANNVEAKFGVLRRRLDQLGYKQPLGLDAVPLAERMLCDLLHTTESLREAEHHLSTHQRERDVFSQHVEPYKQDNAKLVQENNTLHSKIIKAKEGNEAKMRELKSTLKRMDHENTDLKFLNSQYLSRVRQQERECHSKSEKINLLQEKNQSAVIQTPGGSKRQVPPRRQRMELDSFLPPLSYPPTDTPLSTPDPELVELMGVADERIKSLQTQVDQLRSNKSDQERSNDILRQHVQTREREIERLHEQLSGGRPPEVVALEAKRDGTDKTIEHMNIQIELLQEANKELEERLHGSTQQEQVLVKEATGMAERNAVMFRELESLKKLTQVNHNNLQGDLDNVYIELNELKGKLRESEESKEQLEVELAESNTHSERIRQDNDKMLELLGETEADCQNTARLIEKLEMERNALKDRCIELAHANQELAAELDIASQQTQVPAEQHGLMLRLKKAERERDLLRKDREERAVASISFTGEDSQQAITREFINIGKERDQLKKALKDIETEIGDIQDQVKLLTKDRDNYKLLYEQTRHDRDHSQTRPSHSPRGNINVVTTELDVVREERDALRDMLKAKQEGILPHKSLSVDLLTSAHQKLEKALYERDHMGKRLAEMQDVIRALESQLKELPEHAQINQELFKLNLFDHENYDLNAELSATHTINSELGREVGKLSELVRELDKDRDNIQHTLDTKILEYDQLREEMEAQMQTENTLRASIEDLKTEVSIAGEGSRERDKQILSLTALVEEYSVKISAISELNSRLSEQVSSLKEDLGTMTKYYQECQRQLQESLAQRSGLQGRVEELDRLVDHFQQTITDKEREKASLVTSVSHVTAERDQLDSTVQQTLSDQSSMHSDLDALRAERDRLEQLIQQQSHEMHQTMSALGVYEQQLSEVTQALAQMEALLRQAEDEKKALLNDLNTTRELCHTLDSSKDKQSRQLAETGMERDQYKAQIGSLRSEVEVISRQLQEANGRIRGYESLLSQGRSQQVVGGIPIHPMRGTSYQPGHAFQPLASYSNPSKPIHGSPTHSETSTRSFSPRSHPEQSPPTQRDKRSSPYRTQSIHATKDLFETEKDSMQRESAKLVQKLSLFSNTPAHT